MKPGKLDLKRAAWLEATNRYYSRNRDRIVLKRTLLRRAKIHRNRLYPECAFLAFNARNILKIVIQKFCDKQWRRNNRDKVKARHLRWRTKDPVRYRASRLHHHYKRRSVLKGVHYGDCRKKIEILRKERFCHWCCKKLFAVTIDHVIPLTRGGLHVPDNLVASCQDCNFRRHNKLVHEWLPYQDFQCALAN